MAKTYYEILGIEKGADDAALKKAFRTQAKKYHPDVNKDDPEAEAKFKEVNEAYSVLSDPEKRQRYDALGHDAYVSNAATGGTGSGGFGGFSGFSGGGFGDIFDAFFGGGGFGGFGGGRAHDPNAPVDGSDIRTDISITLEEAYSGVTKEITFTRDEVCSECSGSGARPGTGKSICSNCNGTGQVTRTQRTAMGNFTTASPCPKCGGAGQVIESPCDKCRGKGVVSKSRTLRVKVPAGIDNGQYITLRGEGNAGLRGGENGDVFVVSQVKRHDVFKRDGNDLYMEVPISFSQAALGGEVIVHTLGGDMSMKVNEGTQTGTVMRLRGCGMPKLRSLGGDKNGDLYATLVVKTPTKLNDKQRDLLIQLGMHDPVQTTRPSGKKRKLFKS